MENAAGREGEGDPRSGKPSQLPSLAKTLLLCWEILFGALSFSPLNQSNPFWCCWRSDSFQSPHATIVLGAPGLYP